MNTVDSLKTYDKIEKAAKDGEKPLNSPRKWQKVERDNAKRKKKHNWATRGGCVATIIKKKLILTVSSFKCFRKLPRLKPYQA